MLLLRMEGKKEGYFKRTDGSLKRSNTWCWSGTLYVLRELFNIPSGVGSLRMSVFDRPRSTRHTLLIKRAESASRYPFLEVPALGQVIDNYTLDSSLLSLLHKGIKKIYIEVDHQQTK